MNKNTTKLFLAFHKEECDFDLEPYECFYRCIRGEFRHCELAFQQGDTVVRCTVFGLALSSNPHVFRASSRYDDDDDWVFLRVPCTPEQMFRVNEALVAMVERKEKLSYSKMVRSGMPWVPDWMLRNFFYPDSREADEGTTFCSEVCLRALQHAGFLPNHPSDLCTASDLYLLAKMHLGAEEVAELVTRPQIVDSAGLRRSNFMAIAELC
jgi:hypothetical protein